jgi:hypothetical protein
MIKLKELLNEASMSSDSKKFLKGMKKIPYTEWKVEATN